MRNLTTEFKVGLLILAGVAIVVYGSVLVTGWEPGRGETYRVSVSFSNASGLLRGSPVQVAGIKVGDVADISLENGRARIDMDIFTTYTLYADANASIRSLGILGDKYIDLVPGNSSQAALREGDSIGITIEGQDLDSLVTGVSDVLADVKEVTGALRDTLGGDVGRRRLNAILDSLEVAAVDLSEITDVTNKQMGTIVNSLASFSQSLERIGTENEEPLGNLVANAERFTATLDRITTENEAAISNALVNLDAFTASLRRLTEGNEDNLDEALTSLRNFAGSLERVVSDNEERIDGMIADLGALSGDLRGMAAENRAGLKDTIDNLASATGGLREVIADNQDSLDRILVNLDTLTAALAKDGPTITSDLRDILSENKEALNSTVKNLDRSFAKLDETMANLQSVTAKLDEGQGTLGALINDETTVEELNSALAGVNRYITELQQVRLELGGHTEYLASQEQFKSYFTLKLQPLKDRYYQLQIVDNPRGTVSSKTVVRDTDGVVSTTEETETTDALQLSLLLAQRYYDTVLRGGIMESEFGLGVDQYFGATDQYRIGLDVWDFGNDLGTHLKLTGYWRFFSNAFFVVGGDDLLSSNEDLRDAFFGVGLSFTEDNLKPFASSLPLPGAN